MCVHVVSLDSRQGGELTLNASISRSAEPASFSFFAIMVANWCGVGVVSISSVVSQLFLCPQRVANSALKYLWKLNEPIVVFVQFYQHFFQLLVTWVLSQGPHDCSKLLG